MIFRGAERKAVKLQLQTVKPEASLKPVIWTASRRGEGGSDQS